MSISLGRTITTVSELAFMALIVLVIKQILNVEIMTTLDMMLNAIFSNYFNSGSAFVGHVYQQIQLEYN